MAEGTLTVPGAAKEQSQATPHPCPFLLSNLEELGDWEIFIQEILIEHLFNTMCKAPCRPLQGDAKWPRPGAVPRREGRYEGKQQKTGGPSGGIGSLQPINLSELQLPPLSNEGTALDMITGHWASLKTP